MKPSDLPYYESSGTRYPRVSAILSILRDPDVEAWQARVGDKAAEAKRKHAERVGTILDKLVKQEIQGHTVKLPAKTPSEVRQGWKAWQEYVRVHGCPLETQVGRPTVSDVYGYGGEPDLYHKEGYIISDLKATSRIREKFWIQLTAYVPLLWPERDWQNVRLRIIRLDTFLGTCEVKERPFVRQVWETFMYLEAVYRSWYGYQLQPQEAPHVAGH